MVVEGETPRSLTAAIEKLYLVPFLRFGITAGLSLILVVSLVTRFFTTYPEIFAPRALTGGRNSIIAAESAVIALTFACEPRNAVQ